MEFSINFNNHEQAVNVIANELIKRHLNWSGSDENMPSRDLGGDVYSVALDKYEEFFVAHTDMSSINSEAIQNAANDVFLPMFVEARTLADKKWEAAKLLLGIK